MRVLSAGACARAAAGGRGSQRLIDTHVLRQRAGQRAQVPLAQRKGALGVARRHAPHQRKGLPHCGRQGGKGGGSGGGGSGGGCSGNCCCSGGGSGSRGSGGPLARLLGRRGRRGRGGALALGLGGRGWGGEARLAAALLLGRHRCSCVILLSVCLLPAPVRASGGTFGAVHSSCRQSCRNYRRRPPPQAQGTPRHDSPTRTTAPRARQPHAHESPTRTTAHDPHGPTRTTARDTYGHPHHVLRTVLERPSLCAAFYRAASPLPHLGACPSAAPPPSHDLSPTPRDAAPVPSAA